MFWHGHEGCKYYVVPKTKTEWWLNKINGNVENDKKSFKALKDLGWKIIEIWECELKPTTKETTLINLSSAIHLNKFSPFLST